VAEMCAPRRACREPPPGAKTTEQESANGQGEHEHDNGSVVAGHGDSFLVCARRGVI